MDLSPEATPPGKVEGVALPAPSQSDERRFLQWLVRPHPAPACASDAPPSALLLRARGSRSDRRSDRCPAARATPPDGQNRHADSILAIDPVCTSLLSESLREGCGNGARSDPLVVPPASPTF